MNELPQQYYAYGNYWFTPLDKCERRRYSDIYLWLVLQPIFYGLRNVNYFSEIETKETDKIVDFLDSNLQALVWQWWNLGYMCVGKDEKGNYYMPQYKDIRKDNNGKVTNFDMVIYSEKYMFERKSDFAIIKESLEAIDTYKNGDINLTENFGALGILTGKGLPTSPADKEDFQRQLKGRYGIQKEKNQLLLTTMPLDFKQFTLPVKQLELPEKIEDEVKTLCRYFNVPTDLVIGGSTFDNQKQATINFYRNCISGLAEVALKLGRYMMRSIPMLLIPSDKLTFKLDNVAELEDDRTSDVEFKIKVAELIKSMKEIDLDTTDYEDLLKLT